MIYNSKIMFRPWKRIDKVEKIMFRPWKNSDKSVKVNHVQLLTESEPQESESNHFSYLSRDAREIVLNVYYGLLEKMVKRRCSVRHCA